MRAAEHALDGLGKGVTRLGRSARHRSGEFDEVQRVACRRRPKSRKRCVARRAGRQFAKQELIGELAVDRVELDRCCRCRCPTLGSARHDETQPGPEQAGEHFDKRPGCFVDPMNVLEDDHCARTGEGKHELGNRKAQPVGAKRGVECFDLVGHRHICADHVGDQWQPRREIRRDRVDECGDRCARSRGIGTRIDSGSGSDQTTKRKVRRTHLVRLGAHDKPVPLVLDTSRLLPQPALADAGFAHQLDDSSIGDHRQEFGQLVVTTDHRRIRGVDLAAESSVATRSTTNALIGARLPLTRNGSSGVHSKRDWARVVEPLAGDDLAGLRPSPSAGQRGSLHHPSRCTCSVVDGPCRRRTRRRGLLRSAVATGSRRRCAARRAAGAHRRVRSRSAHLRSTSIARSWLRLGSRASTRRDPQLRGRRSR